MSEYARPTNTTNPILDPVLYFRIAALALTAVTILGLVLGILYGGGAADAEDQILSFGSHHGLGLTWTHTAVHGVLALASFVFGYAGLPGKVTRVLAIVFGLVYGALGVLGFLLSNPLGDGLALNLGVTLNAVHILLGAWALTAGLAARYD